MSDHRNRYIDYGNNTISALAYKYEEVKALSKEAYEASGQLREHHKDPIGDIKTIVRRMDDVGDRLAEFSDDLKTELRSRYEFEYDLGKAIDAEIVDSMELHHSDHFEEWIKKQRIE